MPCRPIRPAPTTDDAVWLPRTLGDALESIAHAWAPLEVGGILLGYRNASAWVLTHVVGPGPGAHHGRFGFTPDDAFHREAATRIFKDTDGISRYLGDWHTHPGSGARLSSIDKRTLRRIARSREAQCPVPLMMVLGYGDPTWLARVYTTQACWPARAEPVALRLRVFPEAAHASVVPE